MPQNLRFFPEETAAEKTSSKEYGFFIPKISRFFGHL